MSADVCYFSATELAQAYTERSISPVEVATANLERIAAVDGKVHSYITVCPDVALAAARASQARYMAGRPLGPLDGVPFGLKDSYDTAGVRTTGHSRLFADRVPDRDAAVVALLLHAGGVLLGKHAMWELTSGGPEANNAFPDARNPWDVERIPGGSSSGSGAALAAGLCTIAFGSDTGGSIRWPASACGVVGHKPTFGLVSRSGVMPLSWSLDTLGPMSRTVEDAAIALDVVAAHRPADRGTVTQSDHNYRAALHSGVEGLRIGAPVAFIDAVTGLDSDVDAAYREALRVFERLGATVRSIALPEIEHAATVVWLIATAEALAVHERDMRERPFVFGKGFSSVLREGAMHSAVDYVQAQRGRRIISEALADAMRDVDLVATPTIPYPAWTFASHEIDPRLERTVFTRPFNLSGQPAISIPCGRSRDGLPLGLQIVGRPFDDARVLAAAHSYEAANEWSLRRPPLG